MMILAYLLAGIVAGIFGGFFGIGGGIIIIPVLIYAFHFSQKLAQGTALAALIPPIGLLAAYAYWKTGNVDIKVALLIAIGFFVGGWLGGYVAQYLPEAILRKAFAVLLIAVAIKMLFTR
jgi:uncharacterized membrane protein YfcA